MTKFTAKSPGNILEVLIKELSLASTTKARKFIKHGSVHVDGRLIERAEEKVEAGAKIVIEKKSIREKSRASFPVLYDDAFVLVAEKPAGILSEDRDRARTKSFYKQVNDYVRETSKKQERVHLVHRLDLEVSGVMIFAKSLAVKQTLEDNWSNNEKVYEAVIEGILPRSEGKIESFLAENKAMKVYSTTEGPKAKLAISFYKVLSTYKNSSWVEIRLGTGRKNQIRVHMADLKAPIVGDRKYGARNKSFGRIALHARKLSFDHPVSKKRITVEAELGPQMKKLLSAMHLTK